MHVYVFYLMDAYNNLSSCLCSLYSICIFKHKNIENPPVRKWYLVLSANKAILYIPWLVTKIEAQHYFTKRLKCISTQKGADPAMSSFPLSEIKDSWFEQLQLQCKLPLLLATLGFHKCTWPHPIALHGQCSSWHCTWLMSLQNWAQINQGTFGSKKLIAS